MNPRLLLDTIRRAGEDEVREAAICLIAETSLSAFIFHLWHLHHEEEPITWSWHIGCIAEHLEACVNEEISWLLINVPPGFGKSLICSVYFPAWVWLRRPWYKFLCMSTNDHVTLRDARRHRQLIESQYFRRIFRPSWSISARVAADSNFATTRGGHRVSRTVRSSIIGARPHCRIVDDPNDPTQCTADECTKVNQWIENTLLKRRAKLTSPLVGVQQRLNEIDFTGYLLSRGGGPSTVHLVLPNRYEPDRVFSSPIINRRTGAPWTDPRTEKDELLFPLILDQTTTDQEREASPEVDEAQNQQNPTPPSGIIFKRDSFRRWSPAPTIGQTMPAAEDAPEFQTHPLPEKFDYEIITCDLNNLKEAKATRNTDWSVFDVWGIAGRDVYLLEQIREKFGVSASIQQLAQLIRLRLERGSLACVLIESKANGPSVIAGTRALLGIAQEEQYPKSRQFIRPWDVQGEDKVQRARAIAYVAEEGRVYVPSEYEYGWAKYWLLEVCGFPNRHHDDRVDTATMAITFLERGSQFG